MEPAGALTALTGYMTLAEIVDVPITVDSGWFNESPLLTVNFTVRPFLYGSEVTAGSVMTTNPVGTITVGLLPAMWRPRHAW